MKRAVYFKEDDDENLKCDKCAKGGINMIRKKGFVMCQCGESLYCNTCSDKLPHCGKCKVKVCRIEKNCAMNILPLNPTMWIRWRCANCR